MKLILSLLAALLSIGHISFARPLSGAQPESAVLAPPIEAQAPPSHLQALRRQGHVDESDFGVLNLGVASTDKAGVLCLDLIGKKCQKDTYYPVEVHHHHHHGVTDEE
ncbi:hypothetical protein LshimejAT787_0805440 [Lyophyllum shimeji]|uniref:Uncharacterized protein n=1 Tax=Lyophyllum shimeji TaxID=47721 RepID=A0A9P3UPH4_LYOSH|nr:hypothetical protein LshimejAT787_0805440 [Lyophyllum shimeji]